MLADLKCLNSTVVDNVVPVAWMITQDCDMRAVYYCSIEWWQQALALNHPPGPPGPVTNKGMHVTRYKLLLFRQQNVFQQ